MQDRVPVNPGRVLITPENGGAAYYATMTRADNPTQEGTPLNKNTLLTDATAALFGLGTDAVPDDILSILSNAVLFVGGYLRDIGGSKVGPRIETGSYVGNGTSGYSNQNSLEFGMYANLVFIFADNSSNNSRDFALFIRGASYGIQVMGNGLTGEKPANISLYSMPTFTETGVSWYSDNNPITQLNTNGTTYNYLAI